MLSLLVIGGAGFVGLNIVEAALARGEDVVCFDRRPPQDAALRAFATLPGRLDVATGDVRDEGDLARAFAARPERMVYGAALTAGPDRDAATPDLILEVNLVGLAKALKAARAAGVRRSVNLGSVAAFGDAVYETDILAEDTPQPRPATLYALTKSSGETLCRRLAELWGADIRGVRLSSVFGPWEHDTGVRDTLSPQYQMALAARDGAPALLSAPGDRDWVYARDVASGVLALLDAAAPRHELYQIGPGRRFTLLDWGARLARRRPGFAPRLAAPGEAPTVHVFPPRDRGMLDIGLMRDDLGWEPRFGCAESADDYLDWLDRAG